MVATSRPTAIDLGVMYDEHTSLLTHVMGGFIRVGRWKNPRSDETIGVATGRMTREVADRLSSTPGQRILDVGCGTGKFAVQIATTHDVQITGITVSNHQVEVTQTAYDSIIKAEIVGFQLANAMKLQFVDTSFDGAYATESLVSMDDRRTALANIARVLRSRLAIADLVLDAECPNPEALSYWHELFEMPTMPLGDELKGSAATDGLQIHRVHRCAREYSACLQIPENKARSLEWEFGQKVLQIVIMYGQVKSYPKFLDRWF